MSCLAKYKMGSAVPDNQIRAEKCIQEILGLPLKAGRLTQFPQPGLATDTQDLLEKTFGRQDSSGVQLPEQGIRKTLKFPSALMPSNQNNSFKASCSNTYLRRTHPWLQLRWSINIVRHVYGVFVFPE